MGSKFKILQNVKLIYIRTFFGVVVCTKIRNGMVKTILERYWWKLETIIDQRNDDWLKRASKNQIKYKRYNLINSRLNENCLFISNRKYFLTGRTVRYNLWDVVPKESIWFQRMFNRIGNQDNKIPVFVGQLGIISFWRHVKITDHTNLCLIFLHLVYLSYITCYALMRDIGVFLDHAIPLLWQLYSIHDQKNFLCKIY